MVLAHIFALHLAKRAEATVRTTTTLREFAEAEESAAYSFMKLVVPLAVGIAISVMISKTNFSTGLSEDVKHSGGIILVGLILVAVVIQGKSPQFIVGSGLMIGITYLFLWHYVPSWFVYDLGTVVVSGVFAYFLAGLLQHKVGYVVLMLVALMVWDIYAVFFSTIMADMVGIEEIVAGERKFPPFAAIIAPKDPSVLIGPVESNMAMILGSGDLVFPAILSVATYRYRLHWWVVSGAALGKFASAAAVYTFHVMMSALLFLVPAVIGMFFIGMLVKRRSVEWW